MCAKTTHGLALLLASAIEYVQSVLFKKWKSKNSRTKKQHEMIICRYASDEAKLYTRPKQVNQLIRLNSRSKLCAQAVRYTTVSWFSMISATIEQIDRAVTLVSALSVLLGRRRHHPSPSTDTQIDFELVSTPTERRSAS